MKPRTLIVGTVPYNKRSSSRAFESYFANWEKENLAQIFSNTKTPTKGHCSTMFQITDQRLLKRRLNKNVNTGIVYNENDFHDEWVDNSLEVNSSFFEKLYKIGSRKKPLIYLLRKQIWKKEYWCTKEFNKWLDEFSPECVFLSFSDDFFISEIGMYVAQRYNIPIVSAVGDDYYFNDKFSISPFYYLYKSSYKKMIRKVFNHNGDTVYIGNKIRNRYNNYFRISGKTIYLTSEIQRKDFKEINPQEIKVVYCGNIRLGRNHSLNDIGNALGKINPLYKLDIYSNESDKKYYEIFHGNPNIRFHGSIPYSEVQAVMLESDINVIVEGFNKKDVDVTRYSLSTKVADSLATGANILGYGSVECGAIEYLNKIKCGVVCTQKKDLVPSLINLINNKAIQREFYIQSSKVSKENHSIEVSTKTFEKIVKCAVESGG